MWSLLDIRLASNKTYIFCCHKRTVPRNDFPMELWGCHFTILGQISLLERRTQEYARVARMQAHVYLYPCNQRKRINHYYKRNRLFLCRLGLAINFLVGIHSGLRTSHPFALASILIIPLNDFSVNLKIVIYRSYEK